MKIAKVNKLLWFSFPSEKKKTNVIMFTHKS